MKSSQFFKRLISKSGRRMFSFPGHQQPSKDYYKVLGVDKNADKKKIKSAYAKLAKKYHPDKNEGNDTKFKEIAEAYGILGSKSKKKEYDSNPFHQAGGNQQSQYYGNATGQQGNPFYQNTSQQQGHPFYQHFTGQQANPFYKNDNTNSRYTSYHYRSYGPNFQYSKKTNTRRGGGGRNQGWGNTQDFDEMFRMMQQELMKEAQTRNQRNQQQSNFKNFQKHTNFRNFEHNNPFSNFEQFFKDIEDEQIRINKAKKEEKKRKKEEYMKFKYKNEASREKERKFKEDTQKVVNNIKESFKVFREQASTEGVVKGVFAGVSNFFKK